MTNVTATTQKKKVRQLLVRGAEEALEGQGWKLSKVRGGGNGRLRKISKDGVTKIAAIRTTQDTWIAFPRTEDDSSWVTLSDVDVVVAASVADTEDPRVGLVHFIDAQDLRDRFDRAYAARRAAGHTIPVGRGVWLSLYDEEGTSPVQRVGAGAGLAFPPIARIPLDGGVGRPDAPPNERESSLDRAKPLTIAEARERLAASLGVDPSTIRITIEA